MKKLFFLITLIFTVNLFAQESNDLPIFSKFRFGILTGVNFNSIPTAGPSLNLEIKTNITRKISAKFSVGYSDIYNDNSYSVKSYSYNIIENHSWYGTELFNVDKVRYSIIPISLGVEYVFSQNKISPFTVLEVGYNASSAKAEGKIIVNQYTNLEQIPTEYRQSAPYLKDGSSFTAGAGLGIKYSLTDKLDLSLIYLYHYNDLIINNSQVLVGLTF